MMFTRLPLWRIITIDRKYYTQAIAYWPVTGYVTGFTTAAVLWLASGFMPILPACALAVIARLLLTGALHEDGLADFIDGFGGGTTKERTLAIMKDSHMGCYGTIGLIAYFILYVSLLSSFDADDTFFIILAADCFSKLCAAVMTNSLPYVRKEEESKVSLLYNKISLPQFLLTGCISLLPFVFLKDMLMPAAIIPAILATIGMRWYLRKKINGYTGDCCGASVLIIEQAFYIGAIIIYCL